MGMPDWNGPNADKQCTGSAYTDVMGVLVPSPDSEGISSKGSSFCNDCNCGKESTGWMGWQVALGMCWGGPEWEKPDSGTRVLVGKVGQEEIQEASECHIPYI